MIKTLYIVVALMGLMIAPPQWHSRMEEAQALARSGHRHILVNFSGSDWCGPCIVLRKEVFDDPGFGSLADSSLVLVNADFPRMRKNQLPKEQQEANDKLADRYNPTGIFPLTLLLTAEGKVLRRWEGNPGLTAAEWAAQVRGIVAAEGGH